jgi:ethanolamine permease
MLERLLCASDGSKASDKAVAYAVELAKRIGGSLTFLTVTTVSSQRAAKTYFWDQTVLDAASAQLDNVLGSAAKAAAAAGLAGASCVTVSASDIPEAIAAYAQENGFDLIIVGSRSKGAAARLLLGSVANGVASKSKCPVLVVP